MAGNPKPSKRVKPSVEQGKSVAASEEANRLGKSRCVACNARFEPTIEIVFVPDPRDPLELSQRRGLPRHCPECRKIARLRHQFPLLGKKDECDSNAGPILPLQLIASLREYWESIESPLAGCTEFLSRDEDRKIRTEFWQRLLQIFHLADNDEKALRLLIDIAKNAVQGLEGITRRQPHLLRPFARKSSLWPSFIGRKRKALATLHKERLRELQIGATIRITVIGNTKAQPRRRRSTCTPGYCVISRYCFCLLLTSPARHQDGSALAGVRCSSVRMGIPKKTIS